MSQYTRAVPAREVGVRYKLKTFLTETNITDSEALSIPASHLGTIHSEGSESHGSVHFVEANGQPLR